MTGRQKLPEVSEEIKISIIKKSTITYFPDEAHTSFNQEIEALDVPKETTLEELIKRYNNSSNFGEYNVTFEIRKMR